MAGPVYPEAKKSLLLEIDCEKLRKVLIKRVKCPSVTCLFLPRLYYPLCVSRRIDTWHIVYLSNKDPCPKILAHKSEIKVL